MKYLVLSDSHSNKQTINKIINDNSDVDAVLFAGDGETDLNSISLKTYKVKGNCDLFSKCKSIEYIKCGKHKIMIAHGHHFFVKLSKNSLINYAKKNKADIVVFGHTHKKFYSKQENMLLVNPGSIANEENFSYAILEIINDNVEVKFYEK